METVSHAPHFASFSVVNGRQCSLYDPSSAVKKHLNNYQSTTTTNVTTPDDSFEHDLDNERLNPHNETGESFEFDVKPKTKKYNSPEEYKKKYKTEMCKNYQLKGTCKFGDKCSFAHGTHELKEKVHLHTNYKTKKCKQFHTFGHCFYGYRCQYLHNEPTGMLQLTKKWASIEQNMLIPEETLNFSSPRKESAYSFVEQLEKLEDKFGNEPNLPIMYLLDSNMNRSRLPIFSKFTSGSVTLPSTANQESNCSFGKIFPFSLAEKNRMMGSFDIKSLSK